MTQTISRLYSAAADAEKAVAELMRRNYSDVFLFKASSNSDEAPAASPTQDGIIEAMIRAYIYRPHAKYYAARIAEGASLVTVHAPFGSADRATRILERFEPLADRIEEAPSRSYAYDDRTPISSCLQLPVLTKTQLPFETLSGMPTLTRPHRFMEFFMPSLTGNATPLSRLLGMSTLSSKKTPLSSMFGMATLTSSKTPLSSMLGMPLLKRK